MGATLAATAVVLCWRQAAPGVATEPPAAPLPPALPAEGADPALVPYQEPWLHDVWDAGVGVWPIGWSYIVAIIGPEEERGWAVGALGGSADVRALPALEYVLEHEECGNLRRAAVTASLNLASCYDEDEQTRVGRWVLKETKHPDPKVRAAVFRGVAWDPYYRSGHFLTWLEEALQLGFGDADAECRREAASSASRLLGALDGWSVDPPPGYLDALGQCLLSASPGPRTRASLGTPYPPMPSGRYEELMQCVRPEEIPEVREYADSMGSDYGQDRRYLRAVRVDALVRLWEVDEPRARRLVRESLAEQPLE